MTSAYSSRILCVFAPPSAVVGAGNEMVAEQRLAARAVDQDVSRLEHRDRILGRHDGRDALAPRPARARRSDR